MSSIVVPREIVDDISYQLRRDAKLERRFLIGCIGDMRKSLIDEAANLIVMNRHNGGSMVYPRCVMTNGETKRAARESWIALQFAIDVDFDGCCNPQMTSGSTLGVMSLIREAYEACVKGYLGMPHAVYQCGERDDDGDGDAAGGVDALVSSLLGLNITYDSFSLRDMIPVTAGMLNVTMENLELFDESGRRALLECVSEYWGFMLSSAYVTELRSDIENGNLVEIGGDMSDDDARMIGSCEDGISVYKEFLLINPGSIDLRTACETLRRIDKMISR